MTKITVVCDECGQEVEGLIGTATTPEGEAILMTGGFYIYEFGVSCDDCVYGESGPENQPVETDTDRSE